MTTCSVGFRKVLARIEWITIVDVLASDRNAIPTRREKLVAAAHAACFSMQLSALLGKAGLVPDQIDTTAVVTFENLDQGWTVIESHLKVKASIPGASAESFAKLAEDAKTGCLMSRLLKTTVTMDAKLIA